MTASVLVPIADGTEELEAVTIIDVLRRANINVTVASVMPTRTVTTARKIKIEADCLITDCLNQTFDLIALPGGMPGAANLRDSQALTQLLTQQDTEKKWIAAICASPAVVLAHHKLLKNHATAYPTYAEQLSTCKTSSNKTLVIDDNCITSQGPATALEFALTLVEVLTDKNTRAMIAHAMLVDE